MHIEEAATGQAFLAGKEVHIWQVEMDKCLFPNWLTSEETARASRFRKRHDQERYRLARSMLRVLLAAYRQCDPFALLLSETKEGKPFLRGMPVHFNLSHAGNVICYIFSARGEVGIDVEYVQSPFAWEQIARLYFTTAEFDDLQALKKEERLPAFFRLWTAKEALLKAEGSGLSGMEAGREDVFSRLTTKYKLYSFTCSSHYQGTAAVLNESRSIRYFQLDRLSEARFHF